MHPHMLSEQDWDFINMNSPADLSAVYESDHVCISEYDRCRNGHLYVSRAGYSTRDVTFCFQIQEMQDGLGVGLYCGRGAFTNYVYAAVFKDRLEIRIPSGVPNGDMFMFEGQRNYYVVASCKLETLPSSYVIEFAVKASRLSIRIQDRLAIECDISGVACLSEYGRVFIKAVNENGIAPKTDVKIGGFAGDLPHEGHALTGIITDNRNNPVPHGNVHLAGFGHYWATADELGRFAIDQVPAGHYTLIAGKEGYAFAKQDIKHAGHNDCRIQLPEGNEQPYRTEYPRAELPNSNAWHSLNGYWSFDFDRDDTGEQQMWFARDRHRYSRSINVPFPWSSLLAFGEEGSADSDSLLHANPFTNYSQIIGGIGWYYRVFTIPEDFTGERSCVLHFNAVSGVSKIWVDGEQIGHILDSYNRYSFNLGKMQPGSTHVLAVKVSYPYAMKQACSGKQGFWFTESPGIWQSVWLENRQDAYIADIEVDYELKFDEAGCIRADLRGQVVIDAEMSASPLIAAISDRHFSAQESVLIDVHAPSAGLYKLDMHYTAPGGRAIGEVYVNDSYTCDVIYDCTLDANWSDHTHIWLQLGEGRHRIAIRWKEDPVSPGVPHCVLNTVQVHAMTGMKPIGVSIASPDGSVCYSETIRPIVIEGQLCAPFDAVIATPDLWDTDRPSLYRITAGRSGSDYDVSTRTLGFRLIETDHAHSGDGEMKQIYLNKKPIFIQGIMDQGYNPWGVYTYPAVNGDKGSMAYDIRQAEQYGYNLIRMHVKDNEPHWYSICDERGMLVWDEAPVNFYAKAEDLVWRGMYLRQLRAMMKKHGYHPSVVIFSVFNESWGIEGWHERSPWGDSNAQQFIKEAAREYKSGTNALVIDNSGYASTMETDLIDHHSYPIGYTDARSFWEDLLKHDYPGSTFNFFNAANGELMKNDRTRELLQRNCSQDLKVQQYVGDEVQAGQPILISEFVHTDGNEKLLRVFPKVSGYTRMNLASQENEDTSFMNQLREHRDFGYVNEAMADLDIGLINSKDAIIIDCPGLSKMNAGDKVMLDIYSSIWSDVDGPLYMQITAVGINRRGEYEQLPLLEQPIEIERYKSVKLETFETVFPDHYKAAYLFAVLRGSDNAVIAQDYVQFVMENQTHSTALTGSEIEIRLVQDAHASSDQFAGVECEGNGGLAWVYGTGRVEIDQAIGDEQLQRLAAADGAFLVFEASSCEIIRGVKITDERTFASTVSVLINDRELDRIELEDCPYDDRAIFSRAAAMRGSIFAYNAHSGWGYGYRQRLPLRQVHIDAIIAQRKVKLTIIAEEHGVILYGNAMGRYGNHPFILMEGQQC